MGLVGWRGVEVFGRGAWAWRGGRGWEVGLAACGAFQVLV